MRSRSERRPPAATQPYIGGDRRRLNFFGEGDDKPKVETLQSISEIGEAAQELEILDTLDQGDTAALTQGLEEVVEDLALLAVPFPPGCTWACYLDNNPDVVAEDTEAAALEDWARHGEEEGRDCRCHDETATWEEEEEEEKDMEEEVEEEVEAEVAEQMEDVAEKLNELEMAGKDDDVAHAEKEILEVVEDQLLNAAFPPGCTWECYLDKHPWLADHVARNEAAALAHYRRHDLDEWDCRCHDAHDVLARPPSGLRLQAWFALTVLGLVYWASHQYLALRKRGEEAARGPWGGGRDGNDGASDSPAAERVSLANHGEEGLSPAERDATENEII